MPHLDSPLARRFFRKFFQIGKVCLTYALVIGFSAAANGEEDSIVREFSVQEGKALKTIRRIADQAGEVEILYSARSAKGQRTRRVVGRYTLSKALDLMLEGTQLEAVPVSEGRAYAIKERETDPGGNRDRSETELNQQSDLHNQTMNLPKKENSATLRKALSGLIAALAATGVSAQTNGTDEGQQIYELSPFTIEASDAVGYGATSTLAGTRLRANLKDVAASVSVYTKQFLEDTGATNLTDLLVFTTGTEVAGFGGTLSNTTRAGNFGLDFTAERVAANSTTRVRGLAGADNTRNFYPSLIPLDSYNIERVTINRGANNILFGLGSPAGIIDRSLARPLGVNRNELTLRTDKHGSFRTIFDFDRSFYEGKLNVRTIGLYDWKEFQQDPSFDKNERAYATLNWSPSENTTVVTSYEAGERVGTLPVLAPIRDQFQQWWEWGKPTSPPLSDRSVRSEIGNFFDVPGGSVFGADLIMDGRGGNNAIMDLSSFGGLQPAIIREGDPLFDRLPPENRFPNTYSPEFWNPQDYNRWRRGSTIPEPTRTLARFSRSRQVKDPSIWDYNNVNLFGRNDQLWNDFTAFNVAVQQDFLNKNAGIEVAYDRQNFDNGEQRISSTFFRARALKVDVNEAYPNGDPNPNFGRPFTSLESKWSESQSEQDVFRLTSYLKVDFEEKMGEFGKWFGKHTFTGLYDTSDRINRGRGGNQVAPDIDFGQAVGLTKNRWNITGANANYLYYLGDSVLNQPTPSGTVLHRLPNHVPLPTHMDLTFIDAETRTFATRRFEFFNWEREGEKDILTGSANFTNTETESMAVAWQGRWLNEHLISTVGWRNDKLKFFDAGRPPNDFRGTKILDPDIYFLPAIPNLDVEDDTFSYGLVAHIPDNIVNKIGEKTDLSFHYGESENFTPRSASRNPLGGFFPSPLGETTDYGFTLGLWDERLILRTTWYETIQDNTPDSSLKEPYSRFFASIAQTLYDFNPPEVVEASGFEFPIQAIQDAYEWEFITASDGSVRLETRGGIGDVTTAVSKGVEVEVTANLTDNWRVSFNAAKQNAVRTGQAQTAGFELERLAAAWLSNPVVADQLDVGRIDEFGVRSRVEQQLAIYRTIRLEDGQKANELRKWRWNLITNYSFNNDTPLKGFNIGGAVRWQDRSAIGNQFINDPELGIIPNVTDPVWGPRETIVDAWIGYKRKIWKDIDWSIQLNVQNVMDEDDLVPVFHNPDGSGDVVRLARGQEWFITSKFRF